MKKNTGIKRIICAGLYSWQGFRSALSNETAFQQEFIGVLILSGLSLFLDVTHYERVAMIISLIFILIVEVLNSAIECVVDRVGTDHHDLSGRAKDYGSFAVFLSILIASLIWVTILL